MRIKVFVAVVLLILTSGISQAESARKNKPTCLIQADAIAGIKMGMTVKTAKKILNSAKFLQDSGSEGVQFLSVKQGDAELLFIGTGEGTDSAPTIKINPNKKIVTLGTFHTDCKTAKGIGPGSLVKDAEEVYGPVESIQKLGSEWKLKPSGQRIKFTNQPQNLNLGFYIDESGIFPEGEKQWQTRTYRPDAKILVVDLSADNNIFKEVLSQLKKTKVPPQLPTYFADEEETQPLYAILEKITSNHYAIELAFDPSCHTATACHYGTFSGEAIKKLPPLKSDQQVKLSKNMTGYFVDAQCGASCSDSTLTWEQKGYRYSVGIKAGKKEQLIKVANSAILNSSKK